MGNQKEIHPDNLSSSEIQIQLILENELLRFRMMDGIDMKQEIVLKLGYRFIAGRFFKHEIPTFDETDYAINYIEDELMSDKTLLQSNKELFTADNKIKDVFQKNKITGNPITRQRVEDLFNRYARAIMGAPLSTLNAGINAEDFAIILVLREIMHHLDFDVLKCI